MQHINISHLCESTGIRRRLRNFVLNDFPQESNSCFPDRNPVSWLFPWRYTLTECTQHLYEQPLWSRNNSVAQRWSTGWMIGGSSPGRGWEFFSSPPRPEPLWGPSSLLSHGYQGLFPWGKSGRGVKLTTHLQSPNTPPWRGAQLKQRDSFTFTFTNSLFPCSAMSEVKPFNTTHQEVF
jgi:hypothetical protein